MHTETCPNNTPVSKFSLKLAALQPRRRATNQAKFAENYDEILDAINRGVSSKAIRAALAEEGVTMSSATFKKLLGAERMRREASSKEGATFPPVVASQMEKPYV
jgi:hypothetical protein